MDPISDKLLIENVPSPDKAGWKKWNHDGKERARPSMSIKSERLVELGLAGAYRERFQ